MPEPIGFSPSHIPSGTKTSRTAMIIGGIVILLFTFFTALVAYYIWQIRYGNAVALQQAFQGNISTTSGLPIDEAPVTAEQVTAIMRKHNPIAGNTKANVTIVAFIDFECPYCQAGYVTFKDVMDTYGPAVKIVFKNFPIESLHPDSMSAALAGACAEEQHKFWEYYNVLFTNKQLDRDSLIAEAKKLNLSTSTFTTCLDSGKYSNDINEDLLDGTNLSVRGTPTYFVNNTRIEGVVKREVWDKIIIDALKK